VIPIYAATNTVPASGNETRWKYSIHGFWSNLIKRPDTMKIAIIQTRIQNCVRGFKDRIKKTP
jgi:hypothetical protein